MRLNAVTHPGDFSGSVGSTHGQVGRIDRMLDGLAHLCIVVAGVLLVYLIASFGWLVFGRYVLNDTPTWVEQSALLCVVYITCLGAAAGVRQGTHLSIEMVREAVPAIPRLVMLHLADVFVVLFGAFMCWQGSLMMLDNFDRPIPMIGISESWRAAPLVICGVLMVLFSLANILRRGLSSHSTTATDSEEEQ